MNRKERRASKELTKSQEERMMREIDRNAYHWGEVKRIKREYDALSDEQKVSRKAEMACEIDEHLAALIAN